jgi:ribose transport system substrate-binding protein
MKKRIVLILVLVMLVTITACQPVSETPPQQPSEEQGQAPAEKSDETYVFLTALANLDYWTPHKKALEDACAELGVTADFVGDNDYDQAKMVNLLDTVISKKPAGIVTSGQVIEGYIPLIKKAKDMGIPAAIVTLDIPGGDQLVFIGTDYVKYGRTMGDLAAQSCGGKGKVIISTFKESGNKSVFDMEDGIRAIFDEKYSEMEIVAVVEDKADAQVGAQAVGSALQAHPDANVVIALQAEPSAMGAVTAIREAGLQGKVNVIGMDLSQAVLEQVKEGNIYASVAGKQYAEVYYAVKFLYDYNHNKVPLVKDNKAAGISAQPSYVDPGSIVVTKENVDYFIND